MSVLCVLTLCICYRRMSLVEEGKTGFWKFLPSEAWTSVCHCPTSHWVKENCLPGGVSSFLSRKEVT
jgi:hypothetical protein